jgi:hypothetical protein
MEGHCAIGLGGIEARILLTLDKDFRQIAVQRRSPLERSGVVLFRVQTAVPEKLSSLVRAFVGAKHVWAGHVSIVTPDGIQMLATKR